MKVSWFKALGMASLLADELTRAGADGKVTFEESLVIAKDLAAAAGLAFDDEKAGIVVNTVTDVIDATADNKITLAEIIVITEKLCSELGIEFDKAGIGV